MREGWKIVKLGDIAEIVTKGTTPTSVGHKFIEQGINFVKVECITANGDFIKNKFAHISEECNQDLKRSQLKEGDILFSIAGALGRSAIVTKDVLPANTNQALSIIRLKPSSEYLIEFIYKALSSGYTLEQIEKHRGGVAQQNLSLAQVKSFEIPLPLLEEQKRIVAILDEAFAGIDTAIANTEKNLANARELFESYLNSVFTRQDDGWFSKKFSECLRLKSGDGLTSKQMVPGEFLVFGGNGVAGTHNTYNLTGDNVIIGRVGALCGNVRNITENIWLTDNAFKVFQLEKYMDNKFLTYLLNFKNLRSYARQAAQPVISNSSLKDIELNFPESKRKQKLITEKLDEISSEIDRLEIIYQQKLNSLKELKQSLLQKAFSGELTSKPDKLIDEAVA